MGLDTRLDLFDRWKQLSVMPIGNADFTDVSSKYHFDLIRQVAKSNHLYFTMIVTLMMKFH